jgi:phosphoribosyl-AMP cyclohydrolase
MSNKDDLLLRSINWNNEGLIPVITQDAKNKKVLMLAWMNRDALKESLSTGTVVYWSRSRKRLWRKGETSGHTQKIHEIRLDCDGDTLLLLIEQHGGIACHTGRESCFFRKATQEKTWLITEKVLKNPKDIYS